MRNAPLKWAWKSGSLKMMSRDFEIEVMPGLHCWNFINGKPLEISVFIPFDVNQYRRGYLRNALIEEFFDCRNPVQEYPLFHKFLMNQCILDCESYSLTFSPNQIPQDKQACDDYIRNRICGAIKLTNNQITERKNFLWGLDGKILFFISLHSLEVLSYSIVGERVHAKINYSILVRPSVPVLDLSKEFLKSKVLDFCHPHLFFSCCALHFKEPGCLRIYKKQMQAVYVDQNQDPVQEEERLFRLVNMIKLPKPSLISAISRVWNHPAIQKDVLAKQFLVDSSLNIELTVGKITVNWTFQDLYDNPPSTYGVITENKRLFRILKIIHRIFHFSKKPPSKAILKISLSLFLNALRWEVALSQIKTDPLCYTEDPRDSVANLARALVS